MQRQQRRAAQMVFTCGACGARRIQTLVSYDALGFPVCPACGTRQASRSEDGVSS